MHPLHTKFAIRAAYWQGFYEARAASVRSEAMRHELAGCEPAAKGLREWAERYDAMAACERASLEEWERMT